MKQVICILPRNHWSKTNYMRKSYRSLAAFMLPVFCSLAAFSQTITVSGTVKNSATGEPLESVSIIIKGATSGTYTDEKGTFKLVTAQKPPFTLLVSIVSFETQEVQVTSAATPIEVSLKPGSNLNEVVVSATLLPERILESPVSIERVNLAKIRNAPAANYYDILRNIKGVDVTYSSLTYATPSTRGFNGSGNARFNQLVDGMDNQAPGLNFSVGSVIGLTELDVESMELLPGASSALYGPGGMNGTLLINSKNPFKYQGLSYQVKFGIMHADRRQLSGVTPYYDWSVRWGRKISERFAFKIGAQLIHAKDWIANDSTNYQAGNPAIGQYGNVKPGTRNSDPNYNGVNVYGDETSIKMLGVAQADLAQGAASYDAQYFQATGTHPTQAQINAFLQSNAQTAPFYAGVNLGLIPDSAVSRTGYAERDVVNNNTVNFRLQGGLYYKLTERIEASLSGYWGTGNTVYTGSDRYSLKDLKMGQYKLEFRSSNWFLRGYTTQENSGESYNATATTQLFNEAWKPSQVWYPTYVGNFVGARIAGADVYNAHLIARGAADVGRPLPGTQQFRDLFNKVRSIPIPNGGKFLDRTDLWVAEGQYNFGNAIKFVDIIVGGDWKQFVLNSKGTLFADSAGPIKINEFGAYAQVSKSFMDERFKLTASTRYDKNENFEGRFTPRFTAVVKVVKNHNVRLSYQQAYRFPTTQNQWIDLVIGGGTTLIGGLPELRKFYNFDTNPVYSLESLAPGQTPKVATFPDYKPETMRSYEIGYKGLFNNKILLDVYAYFGKYENFLGRRIVIQAPGTAAQKTFSVAVNSSSTVSTNGWGASLDWLLPSNFFIGANVTQDKITDVPPGFVAFFNVPTYRLNVGVGNTGFGKDNRFGFNIMVRNQDDYFYESDFRQGNIQGYTTWDGQVSYKFPKIKSLVKLGAMNMFNKYYKTGFGNPEIGGLYYLSFGYNVLQ